jgi:hypothetical protein
MSFVGQSAVNLMLAVVCIRYFTYYMLERHRRRA